ncbi:hypothetical protein GOODEAATRI_033290 [Goodea atripinnis]|uniref:Uncharacterized protein n=1 Tax=Goodea atripinnis TaxID=208336 RepID=A0ABV0MMQ2_9TELE
MVFFISNLNLLENTYSRNPACRTYSSCSSMFSTEDLQPAALQPKQRSDLTWKGCLLLQVVEKKKLRDIYIFLFYQIYQNSGFSDPGGVSQYRSGEHLEVDMSGFMSQLRRDQHP